MQNYPIVLLVLVVIFTVLAACSNNALATKSVSFIQVLHRHGARFPIGAGSSEQEGELNDYGHAMLTALGEYLRDRYVNNTINNGITGVFPPSADMVKKLGPKSYPFFGVRSVSTDINRTLQSADALIGGLFPGSVNGATLPIVHTVSTSDHDLAQVLLPNIALGYQFPFQIGLWRPLTEWNPGTPISASDLKAIGAEVGLKVCTDLTIPVSKGAYLGCTLELQDIAASFYAVGILADYPLLAAARGRLDSLMEQYFWITEAFQPKFEDQHKMGALAYPWVEEVLQRADVEIGRINNSNTVQNYIYHYSAHDTTIAPAWSALGLSSGNMRPQFGEALILEVILDDATGTFYVQLWGGRPGNNGAPPPGSRGVNPKEQPPSSWYNYTSTMKPHYVLCKTATGIIKNVTDGSCTYTEFKTYLRDSSAPSTPEGLCYISPEIREIVKLTVAESTSAGASTYRQYCGTKSPYACPPNHIVDFSSPRYDCVKLATSATGNGSSTTTTTTLPASTTAMAPNDDTTTIMVASSTTAASPGGPASKSDGNSTNSAADSFTKKNVIEAGVLSGVGAGLIGLALGFLMGGSMVKRRVHDAASSDADLLVGPGTMQEP